MAAYRLPLRQRHRGSTMMVGGGQREERKREREIIKYKLNCRDCQLRKIIFVQLDRPPFVRAK